jgi:hypothetical protein
VNTRNIILTFVLINKYGVGDKMNINNCLLLSVMICFCMYIAKLSRTTYYLTILAYFMHHDKNELGKLLHVTSKHYKMFIFGSNIFNQVNFFNETKEHKA